MQKFRQEKMLKYQALRRKSAAISYNHHLSNNNLNGFNLNKKANPIEKTEIGEEENDNDKVNSNNSNKAGNNGNGLTNEITNNIDTSGSNKTNNESLIDKSKGLFLTFSSWGLVLRFYS